MYATVVSAVMRVLASQHASNIAFIGVLELSSNAC
jgi:hypothetical protein